MQTINVSREPLLDGCWGIKAEPWIWVSRISMTFELRDSLRVKMLLRSKHNTNIQTLVISLVIRVIRQNHCD